MRSAVAMTVLLSLALSTSFSLAQRTVQDLQGILTVKAAVAPPRFVTLRLEKLGAKIMEVVANDGRFVFPDPGSGRYTIVAEAPGFEKTSVDVELPFDQFVTIELTPLRQESRRAETAPLSELRIPESARLQFVAGKKKAEENRCSDAFDHLKKAIRIYAGYGDAHRTMGECYIKLGRPDAAEQEFKLALEQVHRPDLHLELAIIYARRGDEPLMVRQIEFYAAEEPPSSFRDRLRLLLERR